MVNSLENIDKSKVYVDRIEGLDEVVSDVISDTLTGAVSTITTSDLTAGKILVSDANGKVAASNDTIDNKANNSIIATNSTESRTLADRFADVINVKDFGAKGDGVTDDTAAINNAYNVASSKSAKVFFPAGTYLTTSNIAKFLSVIAVGDGIIKRDSVIFDVGEIQSQTNLYVSPDGIGDGLSINYPSSISLVFDYLKKKSFIKNSYIINFASGTYYLNTSLSYIKTSNRYGIVLRGVEPDRVNNIWYSNIVYPDDGTGMGCITMFDVGTIKIENISFKDSSVASHQHNGLYFGKDVTQAEIFNCYFSGFNKTRNSAGISSQESNAILINNSTIENCETGFYCYNTVGSTLNDGSTRNKFYNCTRGIDVIGSSYMHNDYNDFEDCEVCCYVRFGAYCGWNNCTTTNCNTTMICFNNSSINSDVNTYNNFSINDICYVQNNIVPAEYSQGVFLPKGGVNGSWNYGFKQLKRTTHPFIYNVSIDGEDCTKRISVDNKYGLIQSKTTGTGYAVLTDQSQNANRGWYAFYDESGTYGKSGFSGVKNQIIIHLDNDFAFSFAKTQFIPMKTNDINLGTASFLWKEVFAANATINTSDERLKQNIEDIDERVFRAWAKVNFIQYKFKDAVAKKGENARIHFGVIAQRVKEAFESEGLDGFKYGLLCYDEWKDEYEDNEIIDKPAEYDEDGNEIAPAETHVEKKLVRAAGNAYGIRYSEALALECAYQRWRLEQVENKLSSL